MKPGSRVLLIVIAILLGLPRSASASPSVDIRARMIMRETGELDSDLFKGSSKPIKVGNLDYGVLAHEMLITVAVPEAVGAGQQLTVTVKQGKLNVKQTWKVIVGSNTYGIAVAHHPLLVSPTFCGGLMTITAKVGALTEKRTIDFPCAE